MKVIDERCSILFQGREFDYSEIMKRCSRWLSILAEKNQRQGRVLVFLDISEEVLCLLTALLSSDCSYIPVDVKTPVERVLSIMRQADSAVIVTNRKYSSIFENCNVIYVEDEMEYTRHIAFENRWGNGDAYCIFTSGSTGIPKGVLIGKRALQSFINGTKGSVRWEECQSVLCVTSISFDIFGMESIYALNQGKQVVLASEQQKRNPRLLLKLIDQSGIDCIQLTPSRLQVLLSVNPDLSLLKKVKTIMVGGESLPVSLLERLHQQLSAKIYNAYGPSEATIWVSYSELKENVVNIGKPMEGTRFYLLDEQFNQVEDDSIGELYIGGGNLANGYLDNEEETNRRFLQIASCGERVYRSGDLCKRMNGIYYWIGRADNQVKIHGYRIELEEVEKILTQYTGVKEAVVYLQHRKEMQYLAAIVVAKESFLEEKCIEYMKQHLPQYMIPHEIHMETQFPYTINQKVDRRQLIEKYQKENE